MFKLGEVVVTTSGEVWGVIEVVSEFQFSIRYLFKGNAMFHYRVTYTISDTASYNHWMPYRHWRQYVRKG